MVTTSSTEVAEDMVKPEKNKTNSKAGSKK
jgi:hypothetical protein